jgi:hypothetical protein
LERFFDMTPILVENSIILPCSRPEVYNLSAVRKVHYLGADREVPMPEFVDCVLDHSWTEVMETPAASFRYSYVVFPVADRTRMTVTAEITPKGLGGMLAGLNVRSIRKREKARVEGIKKAILAHLGGQTRTSSAIGTGDETEEPPLRRRARR